jgi:hypothetical protein
MEDPLWLRLLAFAGYIGTATFFAVGMTWGVLTTKTFMGRTRPLSEIERPSTLKAYLFGLAAGAVLGACWVSLWSSVDL